MALKGLWHKYRLSLSGDKWTEIEPESASHAERFSILISQLSSGDKSPVYDLSDTLSNLSRKHGNVFLRFLSLSFCISVSLCHSVSPSLCLICPHHLSLCLSLSLSLILFFSLSTPLPPSGQ